MLDFPLRCTFYTFNYTSTWPCSVSLYRVRHMTLWTEGHSNEVIFPKTTPYSISPFSMQNTLLKSQDSVYLSHILSFLEKQWCSKYIINTQKAGSYKTILQVNILVINKNDKQKQRQYKNRKNKAMMHIRNTHDQQRTTKKHKSPSQCYRIQFSMGMDCLLVISCVNVYHMLLCDDCQIRPISQLNKLIVEQHKTFWSSCANILMQTCFIKISTEW